VIAAVPRPYGLLAELTHRCPLHCPYCSNPTELINRNAELPTADWDRVLREAADLGVLHVGFSGGEPLLRTDLSELVSAARACGLYTNLITSSLGLNPARARELREAGLDSIQISFQSDEQPLADRIAGIAAHARKLEAARIAREADLPLTVNVVVHRGNIERLESIIALAVEVGAQRLELANTQYYGWAFKNRAQLLPSRNQVEKATQIAAAAKKRLFGKLEILFVIPDYYSDRPKPCMHGWGNRHLTVNPAGNVLPCPTAGEIRSLKFDNVRHHSLQWIWSESEAFNRFRGTEWMPDPCRSCQFREVDFGGCRCQAALLTGDAAVTDPACALSPFRDRLTRFVNSIEESRKPATEAADALSKLVYRQNPAV
jgi:pyrroloquinoline quinone biosynthesis protein E